LGVLKANKFHSPINVATNNDVSELSEVYSLSESVSTTTTKRDEDEEVRSVHSSISGHFFILFYFYYYFIDLLNHRFGLAVLVWFFRGGGWIRTCWRWRCGPGWAVPWWFRGGQCKVVNQYSTLLALLAVDAILSVVDQAKPDLVDSITETPKTLD
jgi:hypothetical protein